MNKMNNNKYLFMTMTVTISSSNDKYYRTDYVHNNTFIILML